MATATLAGAGVEVNEAQARDLASVGMAICDGLMIQWLLDPDATPGASEVMTALGLAMAGAT